MHFILLKISNILNQSQFFKTYIDDIIWLSYGSELTDKIKQALTNACTEYGLKLTFRKVSTTETGQSLEFLGVLHVIGNSNKLRYFTTSFIKRNSFQKIVFQIAIHTTLFAFLNLLFLVNL